MSSPAFATAGSLAVRSPARRALGYARAYPLQCVGIAVVASSVAIAVLAPVITTVDPEIGDSSKVLVPPSAEAWFGRDNAGMDVFARVVYATRVDLLIAAAVTGIAFGVGLPIGVATGYFRTRTADLVGRFFDVLQSLPVFILAMALVAVRGQGVTNVIVALGVLFTPIFVRLMRAETYALRESEHIRAARVAGASDIYIMRRHIIPNGMGPALGQVSVTAGFAILLTSGLSFIGAGVRPPTPEWGAMVASGAENIVTGEWWPALFPSLAIGVTVFGFALCGDALETMMNPMRSRTRSASPSLGADVTATLAPAQGKKRDRESGYKGGLVE
jgi:peptide/nickel transport system permease protein